MIISGGLLSNLGHTVRLSLLEVLRWNRAICEGMYQSRVGIGESGISRFAYLIKTRENKPSFEPWREVKLLAYRLCD